MKDYHSMKIGNAHKDNQKKSLPFVTVIMPIRNEKKFIERSLGAILTQDYPRNLMEIIIADGMSIDNTREIIKKLSKQYDQKIKIVDNTDLIVPSGMNKAIKIAKGEIVVRIDGHTIIESDYIRQCVILLEQTGADNVGGKMNAKGKTPIAKAIALATSTPFGIGNSKFHYSNDEQLVDTVYMGAFRKEALFKAGLFNEKYIRHQDYELNYRIRRNGGKIVLSPQIKSHYFVRDSITKLIKQYFQYGYWKGRLLRSNPESFKFRHAVPAIFIFALLVIGIAATVSTAGMVAFSSLIGFYLLFLIIATIATGKSSKNNSVFLLPLIFAAIHCSWGIGVWFGISAPKLEELDGKNIIDP